MITISSKVCFRHFSFCFCKNIANLSSNKTSKLFSKRLLSTKQYLQENSSVRTANVCEILRNDANINERVAVKGWVQRVAEHKSVSFVHVVDGLTSDFLQIVIPNDVQCSSPIKFGASIYCEGIIKQSPGSKQTKELQCDNVFIIGDCDDFPIVYKQFDWGDIRQNQHLRMRVPKYALLMRIRSALIQCIHKLMTDEKYVCITTPIITSSDCEGAGEVFTVKSPLCTQDESYFGVNSHLTVSAQLHLEACLGGFSRVYSLSPAFRAENSDTPRRVAEFTMLEVEEAFVDSVDQMMDTVERLCKSMAKHVFENCHEEISIFSDNKADLEKIVTMDFTRITYDEALEIINKTKNIEPLEYGEDLAYTHQKILLQYFDYIPVFISYYPQQLKPFYMKTEGNKALCFDLICKTAGEVCGGSVRENDYSVLSERINETMKHPKAFDWYLDLRKFGSVPHSGFGIGFDRLLQTLTGVKNIKDVIPFPRWAHHCKL